MTKKRIATLSLKYTLLLVGLAGTAGLSALATMRVLLASQEVAVPSVLGRRMPEAVAVAAQQGLRLRVEGKRYDGHVPVDRIAAQDPSPGSRLKSNRGIRVWISLGERHVTVPAVEGESLRTARLQLDQAQVEVARVAEVDDASDEGTILVQHPMAGEASGGQAGVSLLVSRGPFGADYVMPDLIGHRADAVLDGLKRAGLKVTEIRYRSYPGVASGIVLKQQPPAGHRVSPRHSVSLDISKDSS